MNFHLKLFFILMLFSACQQQSAKQEASKAAPDASAITKHKYWISKEFNDALYAQNVIDTLSYVPCGEFLFPDKDTVVITACLSDAGWGTWVASSPTSLKIVFEGDSANYASVSLDEKTGILHYTPPGDVPKDSGYPTEFVAHDGIDVAKMDYITINLGRKRLAGNYTPVPQKGVKTTPEPLVLNTDGTLKGLGDYDSYEPYFSGIGSGVILNPARNTMYLVKNGKETEPTAVAWRLRGDTLSIWNTKSAGVPDELPSYQITTFKGVYVKAK
jgi:hypothetical protein